MRLSITFSALIAFATAQQQDSLETAKDVITGWDPINYLLSYNGVLQTVSRFPGLYDRGRYHDLALLFTPDSCLHFPILKVNACGTDAIETFFTDGSKLPGTNDTAETQALFGSPEITFQKDQSAFVTVEFSEFIYLSADPSTRIDAHGSYNFTLLQTPTVGSQTTFPPTWKIKNTIYDVYVSCSQVRVDHHNVLSDPCRSFHQPNDRPI